MDIENATTGKIVIHNYIIETRLDETIPEFEITKVDEEKERVDVILKKAGTIPFDDYSRTWTDIPIKNLRPATELDKAIEEAEKKLQEVKAAVEKRKEQREKEIEKKQKELLERIDKTIEEVDATLAQAEEREKETAKKKAEDSKEELKVIELKQPFEEDEKDDEEGNEERMALI